MNEGGNNTGRFVCSCHNRRNQSSPALRESSVPTDPRRASYHMNTFTSPVAGFPNHLYNEIPSTTFQSQMSSYLPPAYVTPIFRSTYRQVYNGTHSRPSPARGPVQIRSYTPPSSMTWASPDTFEDLHSQTTPDTVALPDPNNWINRINNLIPSETRILTIARQRINSTMPLNDLPVIRQTLNVISSGSTFPTQPSSTPSSNLVSPNNPPFLMSSTAPNTHQLSLSPNNPPYLMSSTAPNTPQLSLSPNNPPYLMSSTAPNTPQLSLSPNMPPYLMSSTAPNTPQLSLSANNPPYLMSSTAPNTPQLSLSPNNPPYLMSSTAPNTPQLSLSANNPPYLMSSSAPNTPQLSLSANNPPYLMSSTAPNTPQLSLSSNNSPYLMSSSAPNTPQLSVSPNNPPYFMSSSAPNTPQLSLSPNNPPNLMSSTAPNTAQLSLSANNPPYLMSSTAPNTPQLSISANNPPYLMSSTAPNTPQLSVSPNIPPYFMSSSAPNTPQLSLSANNPPSLMSSTSPNTPQLSLNIPSATLQEFSIDSSNQDFEVTEIAYVQRHSDVHSFTGHYFFLPFTLEFNNNTNEHMAGAMDYTEGNSESQSEVDTNLPEEVSMPEEEIIDHRMELCPHNDKDECDDDCPYLHGRLCHLCHTHRLNPYNPGLHFYACLEQHRKQSKEMECNICMEKITELETDRYFGILENCSHCFCIRCLLTWRRRREMANYKACPVCRTPSEYILGFKFWIVCPLSKKKLIECRKRREQERSI